MGELIENPSYKRINKRILPIGEQKQEPFLQENKNKNPSYKRIKTRTLLTGE